MKILGLGKLGIFLFCLSIILIAAGYAFTPNIESFFNTEILLEGKPNVNILIRLYGGFLASSAMTLTANLIIYVLQKSVYVGMSGSDDWLEDVKTVRNFSVYALILLAGILYFVAQKTIVRI